MTHRVGDVRMSWTMMGQHEVGSGMTYVVPAWVCNGVHDGKVTR